jgi:protease-4
VNDLETSIIEWRNIRRKLTFWRVASLFLVAGLIFALVQVVTGGDLSGQKNRDHIARVTIEGVISDDTELLERLTDIETNDSVKALIVSISSPGGTTYGGEKIFKAIRKVAAKKPVVSDIRTMAASAGYLIAIAGDRVIAGESSITGSIGVIFQYPQIKDLLDKIGVSLEDIKSSPMKAEPSPFHPPSEDTKSMISALVQDSYDWFVGLVAERRNMTRDTVLPLANGTIFTGRQALKAGLIDEIGGDDEIRAYLKQKSISETVPVVDWMPEPAAGNFFLSGKVPFFLKLLGFDRFFSVADLKNITSDKLFLDGLVSVWQFADG